MHASQPVNRRPTSLRTKMSSYTSPRTKLSHGDLLGQFCPRRDTVECTRPVYEENLPAWGKTVSPGTKLSQLILMEQFRPTIDYMRQIKIKHAAPHQAQGKLQTADVVKTVTALYNNHSTNVFLWLLALYHIKTEYRMSQVPGSMLYTYSQTATVATSTVVLSTTPSIP